MRGREKIDNESADALKTVSHAIEQRHRHLQGECADRGKTVGRGKCEELWNQIAKQYHNGEDDQCRQPFRNLPGERSFP